MRERLDAWTAQRLCRAGRPAALRQVLAALGRWLALTSLLVAGFGAGLTWAQSVPLPATAADRPATAAYRFRMPDGPAPLSLGAAVLSDSERAWLAAMPEVRVALQVVGAPPFERLLPDGEIAGLQPELLAALARTLGLKLRPVVLPDWPSVLRAVREGQADMVLTLQATAERSAYLNFTLGTVSVPVAVMARAGARPRALESALIALERDYSSNDLVRRRYPQARVLTVDTTLEALRAVSSGDADFYVGSLLEAIELLSHQPVPGLEVTQILQAGSGHYHFGVRKDWAPLVTILNKGITNWRLQPQGRAQTSALAASAAASLPGAGLLDAPLVLTSEEAATLAERAVWRVGAVRGLAMLNDVDAGNRHDGIAADYTDEVTRRLGVWAALVPFETVSQMLEALREGHIDVVPFLTRTEARAREFAFSQPYFDMPYVLVGSTDRPLYWDLGSLRGKRLALAAQHPLLDTLAERWPDITLVPARDGHHAMDLVVQGQAEAAVEVKLFANVRINSDSAGRLRNLGPVEDLPAQFHFATSAAAAPLVPLINRALDDIPASERERLLRRWVAVDLQPGLPWRRWLPTLTVATLALLSIAVGTLWWMRRLAREVQRRRRADEQLDDIGRTMPGVAFRYRLGARGEIAGTFFSAGASAFLGRPIRPGGTLLQQIAEGCAPEQVQQAQQAQRTAFRTGERFRFEAAYQHPDGRQRWLSAEAVRSTTRAGDVVWTGYLIDITEQHRLRQQLAQQADERHVLLASASHELRAPTHALTLALEAVAPQDLPQPAAQALGMARDAARTIALLLNDVLDAARLDLGRLELCPQGLELSVFIEQVVSIQRPVMQSAGLQFELQAAAGLPQSWLADPLRVKQVLTNLLSNAAKYTARGRVTLRVAPAELPDGRRALLWEVQDTGQGISAEQQRRLFEPFASGPAPAGSAQRGQGFSSGLGLSICRRLVDLMGGCIRLSSTPGVGTCVSVLLPWTGARPDLQPRLQEGVVLVCDDDEVSRMLLAASLARLGHAVVEAGSGEQALARWRAGGVRAVVTDLQMPGLDGAGLMHAIRHAEAQRGALERTTIVLCSGAQPPAAMGPAQSRPPYDVYLCKPVALESLAQALNQAP